jgi:predicted CDP-diglyceride synthetase/phosphatidate cytidylyltransferase
MSNVSRALITGLLFAFAAIAIQLSLLWIGASWTTPLRALVTVVAAVLIGVAAGLTAKKEALQAAGLSGFVAGVLMSVVGTSIAMRNPALLGSHPFASVETALEFVSSIIFGTVISAWLIAGIAVLAALPIRQVLHVERNGI